MRTFLLGFNLFILACSSVMAGVIKGKVVDDLKEPLEFVNVALYQQGSATPFKGTISDETGKYQIDDVKDGTYVVKLSFMGYEEQQRTVTLNAQNGHSVNLHTITLKEDRAVLKEVSVATQRAAMKLDIDKKVFDVSQNIATAGLSASEALENIPSVEVDQEGNISLRGSESVTVWINGKAQGLTSDNRGDILQQLPAESIERIEVITNPSSKYSPEGSAGIINIILKRDRKAGYYGGVQLNAGKQKDEDWGGRFGANINYSSGILEAYANIGLGRRVHGDGNWTDRDYIFPENGFHYGYQNPVTRGHSRGTNLFGRAGLTWHVTQKDEISVNYMGMGALEKGKRTSHVITEMGIYDEYLDWVLDHDSKVSDKEKLYYDHTTMDRNNISRDQPHMTNVSAGYRHEWKREHSLDIQGNYHKWSADNNTSFSQTTTRTDLVGQETSGTFGQEQKATMGSDHWELQIDYTQPLGESGKIEAGYKGTKSHENSPNETWSVGGDNEKSPNYLLFNRFIYDNYQHAAYFNYQNRIGKKFGYQLGLRGEYWRVDTESKNYDQEYGTNFVPNMEVEKPYSKNFFKIFPTVFLSYQLPHNQELQANYTRRMHRPWGGQLNSFKNISDSTLISFGNPELTPAFTNSFEFNYLKTWEDHTLSVSAYYRPTSDVIQRVGYTDPIKKIRYKTNENVSEELSSGLETIVKNKLFKVIDLTTTVNLYYYKLDGGDFVMNAGDALFPYHIDSEDNFSWNASMMAQVMLPWQLSFQGTGRYRAKSIIPQGRRDPSYGVDLGLRRAFFEKKLTVNLNVRDVLDSRRFHSSVWTDKDYQESESYRGRRSIMIQVSYSFGNMAGKPNKRVRGDGGMEDGGMDSYNGGGE